jgi:hypothetical protein
MIGLLWNALDAFRKNPPPKVELKEISLPPEAKIPEGTVVLRVFQRMDLPPKDAKKDVHYRGVQRDHLWILAGEQEEILKRLAEKGEADVPERLARRIIFYHLVDSVRGEAIPWDLGDVKAKSMRMAKTRDSQNELEVKLTGSFSLEHHKSSGLKGTLEGVLEIDKAQKRVKSAKIYASGDAFGSGPYTGTAPEGSFQLKFAMVLVNDELSRYMAPHAINFGSPVGRVDEYLRAIR